METLEAVFLGIVQGLTEFLPVSSSGHLTLFQNFMEIHEGQLTFDIAVHVGTLLTVLTVYYREIGTLLRTSFDGIIKRQFNDGLRLVFYVCVASVPTGLMGIFLRDYWSSTFAQMHWVGIFLCTTGFILFFSRRKSESDDMVSESVGQAGNLNWKKALLIGIGQGCAILPGISRSGTTIALSLYLGVDRKTAAFYSFLLMIPAVAGATVLELRYVNWAQIDVQPLIIGFGTAYVAGLVGLIAVIRLVRKGRLELFSPYLWLVGSGLIIYAISQ